MALTVLFSPRLSAVAGVRHAFFTRQGGVAEGVYDSLNLGAGSLDDPAAVAENRRRAAAYMGVAAEGLLICHQVHSARAVVADAPWPERPQADGVVTRTLGIACGALAADCAPILLADGAARVVAAAHAGWRGALGGVVEATVATMEAQGASRSRIVAAVGPCIAQASYEVGLDFLERFTRDTDGADLFFKPGKTPDKRQFDLPGFVLRQLARAGVDDERAEWLGRDTCAEEAVFFSNRRGHLRAEADYGRLLSAIVLDAG